MIRIFLRQPGLFALSYSLLICYFYFNLKILIPELLSKKKVFLFIGITILIYLIICIVVPWIIQQHFMPQPPFHPDHPFHEGSRFGFSGENRFRGQMKRPQDIMRKLNLYTQSTYFLIVFIISTGLKVVAQWYEAKQRLKEMENSRTQAELSFLKSQIHPHFLFNSLNSIYYLTLSKDDRAPQAIMFLSNFLRFVTTDSEKNYIPLEKEIKMLEEYMELQSLRSSEKIDLKFELKGDFNNQNIMPLTFIPFVENAFKYGISAHVDCFIHLKIELNNRVLCFNLENSIIPSQRDIAESSGVGLKNVKQRLELAYPGQYVLEIKNNHSVFSVYLKINL